MIYLAVSALLLAGLLIVLIILSVRKKPSAPTDNTDYSGVIGKKVHSHCPLCGEPLGPGERVHSVHFPGSSNEGIMHIFGCPFCYADHPRAILPQKNIRRCPSCKDRLPAGGHVYARTFKKPNKTHVSVVGCTLCR